MKKHTFFKKGSRYRIAIHIFLILFSLLFILPFIMIISISFSSEELITSGLGGYSLFPRGFTLDAYKMAFEDPVKIAYAYRTTILTSVIGTLLTLLSAGMTGYVLARKNFRYRKFVTFIVFFTMLFGGGTIPTYIVYSRYYHLGNTIWVYILPALMGGAWNILMIRTFVSGIPESLFESAEIDGAKEFTIFFKIALPLSKPVFASIGFLALLARWNNWQTSLIYIRDWHLFTIQYYLQKILNEAEFLKQVVNDSLISPSIAESLLENTPTETLKYALCVIAAGPMLVIFPFFQKYFSKGMVVGAVKG